MINIDSIRGDITKSRVDKAFARTKQLLKLIPNRRVSRKFLDSIQFLEYQYNNLSGKGNEMLTAEQIVALKNRVISGFFAILTEIELISVNMPPSQKNLKKVQLVTEININNEYKRLAEVQTQRIQRNEKTPNETENYLNEKIEHLEKIHKKILRTNKMVAIPVSLYFIVQMVQMYMKWEHEHSSYHDYPSTTSHPDGDVLWEGAILQHLLLAGAYDQTGHGGVEEHGYHSMDSDMDSMFDDNGSDASGGGDD